LVRGLAGHDGPGGFAAAGAANHNRTGLVLARTYSNPCFVGREEEIASLSELVMQPDMRLVSLVGADKTRPPWRCETSVQRRYRLIAIARGTVLLQSFHIFR
jgi:hypothetical protein